jgi:DNA gyrase subunit A
VLITLTAEHSLFGTTFERWDARSGSPRHRHWKGRRSGGIGCGREDARRLVAGEHGIGKRTPFDMVLEDGRMEPVYRLQSRGGKGIITMKANEKTGVVIGALTVRETDEIMLITSGGQMVRTFVRDIREAGRNTQGVKLINLEAGDKPGDCAGDQ